MKNVKCECGHVNPLGTVICESCGRAVGENSKTNDLLDMRYEGTARRSQVRNQTIIDKIWNFFSSVKVGVVLIVLALIASAIGTIFPQEMNANLDKPANIYYEEKYGWFGKIYYLLGFHDLYSSWWYILLVASIGVSLVICSLDRAVPLYKALKKQRVPKHISFMKRQRFFNQKTVGNTEKLVVLAEELLKKSRYKVILDHGSLLAEKGRFSRWGPYVNHIGLIIFLIGVMLRFVPGFYVNEQLWVKEGETKVIPGTDMQYYLTNHKFLVEYYSEEDNEAYKNALEQKGAIVKNFQSNVTLYKASEKTLPGKNPELIKIKDDEIRVNKPLTVDSFSLFQASYKLNEISSMTLALTKKETGEEFGEITIDLTNPKDVYDLGNGYLVYLMSYFPDFVIKNGEPATNSPFPNNPAFAFKMVTPDKPEGEISFVAIQQNLEPMGENQYKMAFKNADFVNYTGLIVRKDLTLPIIAIGGAIFLIGVAQGSFWQHRRIWIKEDNGDLFIAGHTNKNWYGFMREIEKIFAGTEIPIPKDQGLEKEKKDTTNQGVDSVG